MRLTRYCMYKKIEANFKEPMRGKILGVSGIHNFYPLIDKDSSKLTEVYYPEVDLQDLPYENNSFEYVISDQVLDQVEDPRRAIAESYRVLKRGGTAIHTTCFMNYIHAVPKDYWRFTPEGLRSLCGEFSEIVTCGGWGNRAAIFLMLFDNRFRYMRIPETKWSLRHFIATYNEERVPIVTWVVARK